MKTIEQKAAELREKEGRVNTLAQEVQTLHKELMEGWHSLRERIRAGETTGDQIRDLIITRYIFIYPDKEIEQRFRVLQERIKSHQGQYIMVMQLKDDRIVFRGPGQECPGDTVKRIELDIGVLSADSLILDPPKAHFAFPTGGKHATCWRPRRENPVSMHEGDLYIGLFEDQGLKTSPELQIFVGDQEVADWFETQPDSENYTAAFCEVNRLFGRSVEFPKLTAYLAEERAKIIDEYRSLNARQAWLHLEIKKLDRQQKQSPKLQTELNGIPGKMNAIRERARQLGVNVKDLREPVATTA